MTEVLGQGSARSLLPDMALVMDAGDHEVAVNVLSGIVLESRPADS